VQEHKSWKSQKKIKDPYAAGKKFTHQVTGKILCLGRTIDGTLHTSLSNMALEQSSSNEDTLDRTK
jgi:hypothetical protein